VIAALFVQADGVYFNDPRFDPWDEQRDARKYDRDYPVIAHPPCQRWGRLGLANWHRWGGEHNRPGNDGGCFASALESVRINGGVLEHPAGSMAWDKFFLQRPHKIHIGWNRCASMYAGRAWTCEVWQSAYGHKANKATWLYYVGANPPFDLDWSRPRGTHQVGFQDQRGKAANKPTLSKKEANMTPIQFREVLYRLATGSRPNASDHRADAQGESK
jgi:hypothetical protein